MKAKARQIIRASELIPANERWNPLEHVTAQEYIPPVWIGPHVGLRLIQAFKTLARMPMQHLNSKSGFWPACPMEWIDINAKQHEWLNDPGQAREAAAQWARTRRCSAEDVGRMETAIAWPARYLFNRPLICRVVQRVAAQRAREISTEIIALRLRMSASRLRFVNRTGLDVIAHGLRASATPVF